MENTRAPSLKRPNADTSFLTGPPETRSLIHIHNVNKPLALLSGVSALAFANESRISLSCKMGNRVSDSLLNMSAMQGVARKSIFTW